MECAEGCANPTLTCCTPSFSAKLYLCHRECGSAVDRFSFEEASGMRVMRRGSCPDGDDLPVDSASQLSISWRYSSNEYDGLILHGVHTSTR
jgi:hypothetical protein